jgi:hypothetical protein
MRQDAKDLLTVYAQGAKIRLNLPTIITGKALIA